MTPVRWFQLGAALVLLGAGVTGVLSYRHLAAKAATADARIDAAEQRASEFENQLKTLNDEAVKRAEFDQALRDKRATVSHNLDTAAREDPTARDYLSEPLPDSVRNAILDVRAVPPIDRH